MQIYEVCTPDLDMSVQYKILTPLEAEHFPTLQDVAMGKDQYKKLVLEAIVHNLSDILDTLSKQPKEIGSQVVSSLYNGCVMLNPSLDIDSWVRLTGSNSISYEAVPETAKKTRKKSNKFSKVKFLNLERHLKSVVIGQDHAIDQIVIALKRVIVGLDDAERPYGVFLFAGASGVGKSLLAKELHKYLYGDKHDIIRIDCGEYQHKHENAKLIGSPPGYTGYEEGGQLTRRVAENPRSVILIDEIEKAHPDLFNTFLRVFDEGALTDATGQTVSFKETVIILTTNLGNKDIVNDTHGSTVGFGNTKYGVTQMRRDRKTKEAIAKHFNVEFINRIDSIVVFNHLTHEDFCKIAALEIDMVSQKLSKSGYSIEVDDAVLDKLAYLCENSVDNARRISQVRRDQIESKLADVILTGKYNRGTIFSVTCDEKEQFKIIG